MDLRADNDHKFKQREHQIMQHSECTYVWNMKYDRKYLLINNNL